MAIRINPIAKNVEILRRSSSKNQAKTGTNTGADLAIG